MKFERIHDQAIRAKIGSNCTDGPAETADVNVRITDVSTAHDDPSLSWQCRFGACLKLRIYEGGRPGIVKHCDWCEICQSLVVIDRDDQESIAKLVDQNLL